jgi:hypothetical protein
MIPIQRPRSQFFQGLTAGTAAAAHICRSHIQRKQCLFISTAASGFTAASFSGSAFSDLRLDLVNVATLAVTAGVGTLQQNFLNAPTNTIYNIYSTFVIPSVANGIYVLRITRIASGIPVLTSSFIYVRSDKANLDRETVYVRFRHDRFFYNTRYQDITGFFQQFRIHLNVIERQLDSDKEIYKEDQHWKAPHFAELPGKIFRAGIILF